MYKNKLTKEEEERSDYLVKIIKKKQAELDALAKELRAIIYKIEKAA